MPISYTPKYTPEQNQQLMNNFANYFGKSPKRGNKTLTYQEFLAAKNGGNPYGALPQGQGGGSGGAAGLAGGGLGGYGLYEMLGLGGSGATTGAAGAGLTGAGTAGFIGPTIPGAASGAFGGASGLAGAGAAGQGLAGAGAASQAGGLAAAGGAGSAAGAAGAGLAGAAPTGLLTGASPAMYAGAPAAFLLASAALAPSIAKGGQKIGKAIGVGDNHPERKYNPKEAIQSKKLGGQLPGFDKLSDEQKQMVTDQANAMGMLRLPGYADAAGNTVKGVGSDFIKPRFMNFDYTNDYVKQHGIGSRWGMDSRPLTDFKIPGNLKNEARENWDKLTHMVGPQEQPVSATPFDIRNKDGSYTKIPVAGQQAQPSLQGIGAAMPQILGNTPAPIGRGPAPLKGPVDPSLGAMMIPKVPTHSPGFDANGKRINYNRK